MSYTLRVKMIETEIIYDLTYNEVIEEILRFVKGLFGNEYTADDIIEDIVDNNGTFTYTRQHAAGTFKCTFYDEDKEN